MTPTRIFCPSCSAFHAGVIADVDGWPVVEWVQPHAPDDVDAELLRRHRAAIVDEAAAAFAKAMVRGDYEIAGAFAAEVLGNDAEEDAS